MAEETKHAGTQGGSHEEHVKAGEQSHKNTPATGHDSSHGGTQGGSHEQHVEAGRHSHQDTPDKESSTGHTPSKEDSTKPDQQSHNSK